jgi:hypothetical protein
MTIAASGDNSRSLFATPGSTVAFYSLYTIVFFVLSRTQPPGQPWLTPEQTVQWFADRHWGLLVGFALIFVLGGFSATSIALITVCGLWMFKAYRVVYGASAPAAALQTLVIIGLLIPIIIASRFIVFLVTLFTT